MERVLQGLIAAALVGLVPARAPADQAPARQEALALQEAMQSAIQEAEPSVACVLVSRSEVYHNWFGTTLSPDSPGKLGTFDVNQVDLQVPPVDRPQVEELRNEIARRLNLYPTSTAVEHEVKKKFDLSSPGYVPESYGSGVVIDKAGLVLTNYHVVRDARKIYVRLLGDRGSYADIQAADPRSDLAVLQLLDQSILPLPVIKLGDGGHVRKGQLVLSIANPFAAGFRDGSPSASWGIISNIRRRAPAKAILREQDRTKLTLHHFGTLLQTDARLNLGCSGGALIDLKGELIGLTTALAAITGSETAGGFAVPLDDGIKRIISALAKGKEVEYGFLGISFERETRPGEHVRIGGVLRNSPAFRAGLLEGDTIVSVNDTPVRDNDDLFLSVGTLLAGSEARVKVRTIDGRSRIVTVKLAKFDQLPEKIIAANKPAYVRGLRVGYTSVLVQRNPFLREIPDGVYVSEVQPNSPADNARLQGAIITQVNDHPVSDPDEFYREADRVTKAASLELIVTRGGDVPRKVKLD